MPPSQIKSRNKKGSAPASGAVFRALAENTGALKRSKRLCQLRAQEASRPSSVALRRVDEARPATPEAGVLPNLGVRVFEDVVLEDDEFTHDGREGDFGRFARHPQPLVKHFELAVGASGDQGGHVEGAANGGASGANTTATIPTRLTAGLSSRPNSKSWKRKK